MMYFKSTITEQVYKVNFIPKGEGWEAVTEEEYKEYCKKNNLPL